MRLYRFQVLSDDGSLPSDKGLIGLDQIMEYRDIEEFCSCYPNTTFKVTTLMDEDEFLKENIVIPRRNIETWPTVLPVTMPDG